MEVTTELEHHTARTPEPKSEDTRADRADAAADVALLYDADAEQRIPFENLSWGFPVTLVAGPAQDHYFQMYAKRCGQAADEGDGRGAFAAHLGASLTAVELLFDAVMVRVEGFEDDEPTPDEWREIFSPQDKAAVVDGAIFGIQPIELMPVTGVKPSWKSVLRNSTVRFSAFFDGYMVEVSHTLKRADAKTLGEYTALMSGTYAITRGGDEHLPKLAAWYDAHHVSHEGYAGRVPLHHRAAAFIQHMTRQGHVVRKN